jgi:hypothetical protein
MGDGSWGRYSINPLLQSAVGWSSSDDETKAKSVLMILSTIERESATYCVVDTLTTRDRPD